tara:strand:+ start:2255 stop:2461 length:207 start_codon:yes stop_codon:yes gene_type:complete
MYESVSPPSHTEIFIVPVYAALGLDATMELNNYPDYRTILKAMERVNRELRIVMDGIMGLLISLVISN